MCYARVSSSKQKSSIDTQKRILLERYPDAEFISDIASAFNFKRKGLQTILESAMLGHSVHIVVATKDRLARSGFELIKWLVELSGGRIEILDDSNNTTESIDTAELIGFITSFCNSHYGKRSAEKRKSNSIEATTTLKNAENESAYFDALALYRRSYNLAVERFRNDDYKDEKGKFINMRPAIKAKVEQEQKESGRAYNSLVSDNGTLAAATTFKAVCSKNKKLKGAKSGFSKISFKSRKGAKHSFSIDRLPKGLNPCVKALGKIHLTESVPSEAIGKSCIITCDKGRWFIQVQQHIELKTEIQGEVKCVGVDQGVRTFAACFSKDDALVVGDNFAKEKLFPLMQRVDKLIGQKQKVLNTQKGVKFLDMPQWARDRLTHFDREINRLKCKKDDLILDLHNRLAHELVSNYDVIFLPSFETKGMVTRKDKRIRTIRRNTCRQMFDLNHYGFKLRLKWYTKKHGKQVVDCNESYTSKTRSWDGSINGKLGSSKIIKGDGFTVDRDINGARNILLKHLTR
ncbi:RNA-guided endonuclease TnpB family protein [Vibrio breoganii]